MRDFLLIMLFFTSPILGDLIIVVVAHTLYYGTIPFLVLFACLIPILIIMQNRKKRASEERKKRTQVILKQMKNHEI